MKGTVNIGHLLSASIDLSRQAGKIIQGVRASGDLQTQSKGVDDPVTIADKQSQELIISGLFSICPGLNVVGEEDTPSLEAAKDKPNVGIIEGEKVPKEFREVELDKVCVYIDPLDATKEYTLGRVMCVMTLIGITVDGVPVAGVMHQPFANDGGREERRKKERKKCFILFFFC